MSKIPNPYDALFRTSLKNIDFAKDFCKNVKIFESNNSYDVKSRKVAITHGAKEHGMHLIALINI